MSAMSDVRRAWVRCICLLTATGLASLAGAQANTAPDVPGNIRVPAGQRLVWQAHALGTQIYTCQANAAGKLQWTLKAPEAELRDDKGAVLGHHYGGPTWKHKDGSEVTGKPVARADSPDPSSIPWLLLTATGHGGSGILARVTSIQRIHTKGGQPPATSCDTTKPAAEFKSPYTADYYFYAP